MPSTWLFFGVSVFAAGSATVYATVRGLRAFRAAKRLARETDETVSDIGRSAAEIESRLAGGAGGGDELAAALARLQASRAQLDVLLAALADVREAIGRVTVLVPRK